MTEKIEWWTGSNGNLFADAGDFRYCIARERARSYYLVYRNGAPFPVCPPSEAEAKAFVAKWVAEH